MSQHPQRWARGQWAQTVLMELKGKAVTNPPHLRPLGHPRMSRCSTGVGPPESYQGGVAVGQGEPRPCLLWRESRGRAGVEGALGKQSQAGRARRAEPDGQSQAGRARRAEPGRQSRVRLKAPGLYKWILLKWKFPPIPEMSLAVRPGLVGLRQLGMWTGTKTELSKPLRPTHPSQCCPHASSAPLLCSGPRDPQGPSQASHSFIPSHFLPQPLRASYTPTHLTPPLPIVLTLPFYSSCPHTSHPPPHTPTHPHTHT